MWKLAIVPNKKYIQFNLIFNIIVYKLNITQWQAKLTKVNRTWMIWYNHLQIKVNLLGTLIATFVPLRSLIFLVRVLIETRNKSFYMYIKNLGNWSYTFAGYNFWTDYFTRNMPESWMSLENCLIGEKQWACYSSSRCRLEISERKVRAPKSEIKLMTLWH